MKPETVSLVLMLASAFLAIIASALTALFKRRGSSLLDPRVSTLSMIREPAKYTQQPYGSIARILYLIALLLAVSSIATVFTQIFRA